MFIVVIFLPDLQASDAIRRDLRAPSSQEATKEEWDSGGRSVVLCDDHCPRITLSYRAFGAISSSSHSYCSTVRLSAAVLRGLSKPVARSCQARQDLRGVFQVPPTTRVVVADATRQDSAEPSRTLDEHDASTEIAKLALKGSLWA